MPESVRGRSDHLGVIQKGGVSHVLMGGGVRRNELFVVGLELSEVGALAHGPLAEKSVPNPRVRLSHSACDCIKYNHK